MRYKFSDLYYDDTKNAKKLKSSEYKNVGKHIIVDQGKALIAGYTDNEDGLYTDVPVIIFGDHTRNIKYINSPFFLGADGTKVLKSPLKNVNYKYLYYLLKNASIPDTGYNRHYKWLKELMFKYHSQDQQNQIVTILDKLDLTISKYREELLLLDELVKARFVEMFGGINDSVVYPYKKLNEITIIISGGTPKRDKPEYWEDGIIPWVKTTELKNNKITYVEEHITQKGLSESSAKLVPQGTVLIAMYGQRKTRGMTAYLNVEASTNQACACILPSEKINSVFLWKYLEFSYVKLRSLAKGAGQPNLNVNMIKEFSVLVPPLNLQEEYASFVEEIDKSRLRELLAIKQIKLLLHDSWFLFY